MKKLFSVTILLAVFFCFSNTSSAQFDKLKQKIKDKVNDRVDQKTDKAIDNALDSAEGVPKKGTAKDKNTNSNSDVKNVSEATNSEPSLKVYRNYDFVPGDKIIFESQLKDEKVGEIPSQFILTEGQMDLQTEDAENVTRVAKGAGATFYARMKDQNSLPEQFTVEFDVKNERFGLEHLSVKFGDNDTNLRDIGFGYGGISWGDISAEPAEELHLNYDHPMTWHHIAIAVNKNQGKVYIDQSRVLNLNNLTGGAKQIIFRVDGYENSYIKNIRIAAGGIDVYKKVATEGKIVTHGILFDIDKASIKAESMGTINSIYSLLKNDASLKFEIDGHTDNSGTPQHNLTLSQQRADAVKTQLINMGIDASRLTSKGFGDTKPISDNNSPEGKANNRRVEFVKM